MTLASQDIDGGAVAVSHPLSPLQAREIVRVRAILDDARVLRDDSLIVYEGLIEPPKQAVLAWSPGEPVDRSVRLLLLDQSTGIARDVVVSLSAGVVEAVTELDTLTSGHVPTSEAEGQVISEVLGAHPEWRAALLRRGVDPDRVIVNRLSAGNFGLEADDGRRLYRALPMLKETTTANHWMHPVGGLSALVDVTARAVVAITDDGVHDVPRENADYTDPKVTGALRSDLKPIEITQPEGPSFRIDDNVLNWANWNLRVSFNQREGLTLHQIGFRDGDEVRPIVYRASIAEMVVPYASPGAARFWQNYFDVGEYLYGRYINPLENGCDCLGDITYLDAVFADEKGDPVVVPNGICIHEEDFGILWKHTDGRSGRSDVRRQRRLVISMFTTVGNYDYGLYWYFYLDGRIEFEAKLTGLVFAAAYPELPEGFSMQIAPGLGAPNHQHLFNARLHMMVDGTGNSIDEIAAEAAPMDGANPFGNGFRLRRTSLSTEQAAVRDGNESEHRAWQVASTGRRNRVGEPTRYELVPQGQTRLLAHPDSVIAARAAFATHTLWVTAYDPAEFFPAGDLVNQHPGGAGLPAYIAGDRPLGDADLVVWHTFGLTHFPRPEDYPIMPVDYAGFTLRPVGFFDRNPALDLPAPGGAHCHSAANHGGMHG